MKNFTKRAVSLLIALTLMLTLSLTAFAALPTTGSGSITVTGGPDLVGKTVTTIQMFTATVSATDSSAVAYTLNPAWEAFFLSDAKYGCQGLTGEALSQAAYAYVASLDTNATPAAPATALPEFAFEAEKWAEDAAHSGDFTDLMLTATALEVTPTTATASFTSLPYGYYLTYPGYATAPSYTDAMLLNVINNTPVTQAIKSVYPTVTKTSNYTHNTAENEAAQQIGGMLEFTLTSAVPDMSAFETFTFIFKDTLSDGLTYEGSLSVGIDTDPDTAGIDLPLVEGTDYTVTPPSTTNGGGQLLVTMTDFKALHQQHAGLPIIVTYQTTLNTNALIVNSANDLTNTNPNSAVIDYSNGPEVDDIGTSAPSVVNVRTFSFDVFKYTGENVALPGAVFQLYKNGQQAPLTFVETAVTGTYRVSVATDPDASITADLVIPATGRITLSGLDIGRYQLRESQAPAGYNRLTSDIHVTISANYSDLGEGNTGAYTGFTLSNDFGDGSGNVAAANNTISVENRAGAVLPSTGSVGTIGLTAAGVALIILGIVFIPRKKKETASK